MWVGLAIDLSKSSRCAIKPDGGVTTLRRNAMKKCIGAIVFLGVMLSGGLAFSQDTKMTTISFEDDRIEGDLMAPTSSNINVKEMDELTSLIKAREDFVDEMRKTVEEL